MTLLAGLQVLLSRYAGRRIWRWGRRWRTGTEWKTEGLIGFFVNTLVLRTEVSGRSEFEGVAEAGEGGDAGSV